MTPLWVRLWHWAIAILFAILVLTGVVLTYSFSHFSVMNYALADTLHQVTGVLFSILFGVFLIAALVGGYWQRYWRRSQGLWQRIWLQGAKVVDSARPASERVALSPLDLSRGLLLLVQQLLYIFSIVILSPLLVLTGLALLYPELAPEKVAGLAGLWTFALAHYWIGLAGALFLLLHIYIATIAGFKRMISGR